MALGAVAPVRPALTGTSVRKSKEGVALDIQEARITIQDMALSKKVDVNSEYVEFEVELKKGEAKLKTWFSLDTEEELGAYFIDVEKL